MYYKKPKAKNLKSTLVKNGNTFLPKVHNKNVYVLENTSQIDSLFNIFFSSYNNFIKLNEFCKGPESKNELFFNTLDNFALNSTKSSIYYENRLLMLLKVGEINKDTIHCRNNVGFYLTKLMGSVYSVTLNISCDNCNFTSTSNHQSILPSPNHSNNILKEHVFVNVILDELLKTEYACSLCKSSLKILYDFNKYICIDIENMCTEIRLSTIQNLLNFNNKQFVLSGVIEVENCALSGLKKYTALCRSLQGFWIRKDTKKKFKNPSESSIVKVALIIYIEN